MGLFIVQATISKLHDSVVQTNGARWTVEHLRSKTMKTRISTLEIRPGLGFNSTLQIENVAAAVWSTQSSLPTIGFLKDVVWMDT